MSKQDGKDKKPETNQDIIEGVLMEGPSLIAQFKDEERKELAVQVDGNFGPFIIIVFDQDGGAHFKQQRSPSVSTWMLKPIIGYLQTIFELEAAGNLMAQKAAKQRSGILLPGQPTLPPHLTAGAKG